LSKGYALNEGGRMESHPEMSRNKIRGRILV
jgi:hypothetical protein